MGYWGPHYGITIDPALVHAVIQKESSHGAKLSAAEPNGHMSYGPMMVYDATARAYGISDPSTLEDPELGIWYGTEYLGQQLKTFSGDTPRAISAYNTGPGNANRDASGAFPNQAYVNTVLGYWTMYRGAVPLGAAAGVIVIGLTLYLLARRRRAA